MPKSIYTRLRPLALIFVLLLNNALPQANAAEQDTVQRLNQNIDLRTTSQERALLESDLSNSSDMPLLELDGQQYTIGDDLDQLAVALYLSIERKHWPAASAYLARYLALADYDPMLIAYAHGALARAEGNFDQAELHYRELLTMQEDFLPGQLELARVLFESRKDRESTAAFEQISAGLSHADTQAMGISRSVDSFLQALDQRTRWQGSLAVGPVWANNLNHSSESVGTQYFYINNQAISAVRTLPKAVAAQGMDYEATLNRRIALNGHHGVYFRSLSYGQRYEHAGKYNESTLNANLGYSFHDARNQYAIGPTFEVATFGDVTLYNAWGLHGEWLRTLSSSRMLKLEADYKSMAYQHKPNNYLSGETGALYATLWQALPNRWTLFGGIDATARSTQDRTQAYLQEGLRLGIAKDFNIGISAMLFTSYRQRQYDTPIGWLRERRNESEQGYILTLRAPRLAIYGATPYLTAKYYTIKNKIDWLYSHDYNSLSLKLEKQF